MSNGYFTHTTPLARHTLARAEELNATLNAVAAGFDRLPAEAVLKDGRVTYGTAAGSVDSYTITLPYPPAAYAEGMRVTFRVPAGAGNAGAAVVNVNGLGVKPVLRNDGSPTLKGDLPAGGVVDLCCDGTAFRLVGSHGGDVMLAQDWAGKADGPVTGGGYSALAWASLTGATAPPAGSARQWAESTGTLIGGTGYSAREHASGDTVPTGSAMNWAVKTGAPVAGGEYSAKHHATQAALSASAAAGSATSAGISATSAGTSATNAGISAAAAAASAAGVNLPPITPADTGKVLTVTAGGAWNPEIPVRGVTVRKEGAVIGVRPTINIIGGNGVSITAADNAVSDRVDLTFQVASPSTMTLDAGGKGSALTLSNGNLTVTAGSGIGGVRTTSAKSGGKYYWEVYGGYRSETGVGLVASTATLTGGADPRHLAGATYVWGHLSGMKKITNNGSSYDISSSAIWGDNTIGIAADLDGKKWWFSINGIWQLSGNPAAGTNPLPYFPTGSVFFPLCVVYAAGDASDQGYALTCRFAYTQWSYQPPGGFSQWT